MLIDFEQFAARLRDVIDEHLGIPVNVDPASGSSVAGAMMASAIYALKHSGVELRRDSFLDLAAMVFDQCANQPAVRAPS